MYWVQLCHYDGFSFHVSRFDFAKESCGCLAQQLDIVSRQISIHDADVSDLTKENLTMDLQTSRLIDRAGLDVLQLHAGQAVASTCSGIIHAMLHIHNLVKAAA